MTGNDMFMDFLKSIKTTIKKVNTDTGKWEEIEKKFL